MPRPVTWRLREKARTAGMAIRHVAVQGLARARQADAAWRDACGDYARLNYPFSHVARRCLRGIQRRSGDSSVMRPQRLIRGVRLLASLPRVVIDLNAHPARLDRHDRRIREILDSMGRACAAAGLPYESHCPASSGSGLERNHPEGRRTPAS